MNTTTMLKATMPAEAVMRRALAERDPKYDGAFVYGVITTGVYCRPRTCSAPSRQCSACRRRNTSMRRGCGASRVV